MDPPFGFPIRSTPRDRVGEGARAVSRVRLRVLFEAAAWALAAMPTMAATYEIQSQKSRVRFEIRYSEFVRPVRGRFAHLSGEIEYDATKPAATAAEVVIDVSSVDTDNGYRGGHLCTSFFEAGRFPEIRFRLRRFLPEEGKAIVTCLSDRSDRAGQRPRALSGRDRTPGRHDSRQPDRTDHGRGLRLPDERGRGAWRVLDGHQILWSRSIELDEAGR
ncbi:MAG: YceI family protein [bacterium]|nr:hypothetical protein [Deltaproteobacteria bacterium]MCP4907815.1 YceI family protein [bacterium]